MVPPQDSALGLVAPVPIFKAEPEYPDDLLSNHEEGDVTVKVWLTRLGNIKKAYIISSTDARLKQPALKAAMCWKFRPAMEDSRPVAVWVTIPFRFRMR